ncbi:MAG TPA: spermidine/putrescine ABC transporter substrate-binding protein [Anaerolineales bacterium]|nr:spermidine/putrescine ABC transporter substrate-binding protein [Anaerolineales bacterium]
MKKSLIYLLVVAAVILTACGGGQPTATAVIPETGPTEVPATEAPATEAQATEAPATESPATEAPADGETADRCGDRSQLAEEIFLYNWSDYLDPAIKEQFQAECGVIVTETNYDSNETLLATLQAGGAEYDLVVPSDYMVQVMVSEGRLMELDYSVIPNMQHIDEVNLNTYFDPEQKYTVPYFWGTSGFAVDTSVVTDYTDSWSVIFDPNSPYCGQISMLDDQRETLGAALMYLGYSINDTDPAHLEEAKNLLIEQSKCVKAYDSETNGDLLVAGETALAHIWTGAALVAKSEKESIEYVIPKEGTTIWQDNLAVPVDAPNAYTAMVFINYLSDPEIAAQNAEYIMYASPNKTAKELIDPSMLSETIYPTGEMASRLQWIEDVGDALELYDRVWTEFKAAVGSQ